MLDLQQHREEKDRFFKTGSQSPLSKAQKALFDGLRYFEPNPALTLEAEIERFEEQAQVTLQTNTGDPRSFIRYGRIQVAGDAWLTVFQAPYGFFLPFIDANAGTETYPSGRYLDPDLIRDGVLRVDFNLAYNPYCAYADRFICPIAPAENRLTVAIEAGEKLPVGDWVKL